MCGTGDGGGATHPSCSHPLTRKLASSGHGQCCVFISLRTRPPSSASCPPVHTRTLTSLVGMRTAQLLSLLRLPAARISRGRSHQKLRAGTGPNWWVRSFPRIHDPTLWYRQKAPSLIYLSNETQPICCLIGPVAYRVRIRHRIVIQGLRSRRSKEATHANNLVVTPA